MKSPLLKIVILLVCIPLWSQTEELVWSDEFNIDGAIDSNNWFHQTQIPAGGNWYNNESQHYTNRLENSYVSGGKLNLVAIKETFTDQGITKEYTSARLNSKVAFQYGRMEIRAKLPTGAGTWPAIWMLGKNINEDGGYWDNNGFGTTPWPECGEIDIMEHWGNNQNYVSSAMHTPSSYGGTFNTGGRYLSTASTAFHVYELDWNAQRMIFSVDGTVHYTYNPSTKDANTWPFDAEQYFLLNVAIEGGGANITQTAMEIDYIRVYQTEGSDGGGGGGGGGGGNPGTTSPTDAPSAPTASAADVISLFSEAYTDVPNTNWTPNWGQSTVSSLETIAGNEVRKYTNLNYIGVELDAAQYQDVSSFEKIHFDYWTADASELSLSLISPGPSENPVSVGAISTGAWQSVDIPLSSYSTPDLSDIFQLKFEGSGTVYIDNVYFYKTGTGSGGGSGGGGNPGAPTPTKAPADVISVYSDAYTDNIATNLNPNWGQATNATEIQIDGNNTLKYENLNYQGLDYSTTDVSAMEYVHLDYKTDDATALDFYLISENPTVENPYSIDIVTGSWQSIDIPLSVYTANLDRVFQFKTVGDGTVSLDNIYFWKEPAVQSTDTSLSNLTVNGSTVTGFSSAITSYTVELPEGSAVPAVIATPTDGNATAVVTDATSLPGNTTVTVTTTGGASQTYTISFVYEVSDSELSAYDNFEGDGNITTWAEDDTTMDTGFSNPFSTGINSSNTVLKYQDAGGQYANIRFDVSENFDLSSNSLFALKIYVPTAGITGNQPNQISLKLQDGTLAEPWGTQCEIIKPIVLDQWQEITFDFDQDTYFNLDGNSPDPMTRSDFNRVVLQVNSENNNDQVVAYLDDFLYNSILSVKEVVRPISMYPNPVKDKLNISEKFDFVEVYNMTGRKVLKSKSSPLFMESLPKGIYLVRVHSKHKTTSSKIIKE
jgi:beta-glucanase (GH16 family)